MPIANDSLSTHAMGGTELMKFGLIDRLPNGVLDEIQLFVSRVEEALDPGKIRILWLHDLPGDPASEHLRNEGWKKFHKLVFTSNWQMQAYINYYKIPWSHCIVLQNAIEPIEWNDDKWAEPWFSPNPVNNPKYPVRLIYTPTPHRGLAILVPVFQKLCEKYDNIELDVFSSFKLYGWEQRDEQWQELYKQCEDHPKINYHGTVSNERVREALQQAHIFAYPSTWPETSCLSLIESMSAGCICVHSNYAALPETSANWTYMYHYSENVQEHAKIFYTILSSAIEDIRDTVSETISRLRSQKAYADIFYSWTNRVKQWEALIGMLKTNVSDRSLPQAEFVYKIG